MQIRYAVFDMDGTLIDSLGVWEVIWSRLGKKYRDDPSFRPDAAFDKRARTMLFADTMAHVHNEWGFGESAEELLEFLNEICYEYYHNTVLMKDGVIPFLEACRQSGAQMCLATASDMALVNIAVERFGLSKYFSAMLSCADIGKGKDQPDIYLLCLDRMGATAEETWIFEDSATALLTARRIGMKTVGIYDQYNYGQDILKANSDYYIDQGETVMKLLNKS